MRVKFYLFLIVTVFTIFEGYSQSLNYNVVLEDKSTFIFYNYTPYTLTVQVLSPSFDDEFKIINGQKSQIFNKIGTEKKVKQVNYLIVYEESAYDQMNEILEGGLKRSFLKLPEQFFTGLEMTREKFIQEFFKATGGPLLKRGIQLWQTYQEFMQYKAIVDEIISLQNQIDVNNRIFSSQFQTNSYTNSFKEQTVYYDLPSYTPRFVLGVYWPSTYPDISNEWHTKGISGRFGLNMGIKITPEIKFSSDIRSRFLLDLNYQRMGYVPNKNLNYFAGKPYINSSLNQEYFLLNNTENISFMINELSAGLLLTNYIGPTFSLDFGAGVKALMKNYIKFDQEEVAITGRDYNLINDKITNVISFKSNYTPYITTRITMGSNNLKGFVGYTLFTNNMNDQFNSIYVGNSNDPTDQGFEINLADFQDRKINYHFNFGVLLVVM